MYTSKHGDVIFASRKRRLVFTDPVEVVHATALADVAPCLDRVESHVARGHHAAGFISYEAAPALDGALETHAPSEFPLLWFGLYGAPKETAPDVCQPGDYVIGDWRSDASETAYNRAIDEIRGLIEAGDTYQVNYTFRLRADFAGDPLGLFHGLCRAQQADYCAYVDTGRFKVASASPELFFSLDGNDLETRPMKGTRARGRWCEEDESEAAALAASEKDRAENVMIVDLLRNDMGRISETGSVCVPRLFDVERYPTVWQMTSTIRSRTRASVPDIFRALFPSGSVTGAPKVRTMQIIRGLEVSPRGIYCGCMGWWAPDRKAEFNVAIRTVAIDSERGVAEYGVGGGITWGSVASAEFNECAMKAAVLARRDPGFGLLESLLFDGEYFLLDAHLERMEASARYFGFRFDKDAVEHALRREAASLYARPDADHAKAFKVRLLLARDGSISVESAPAASQDLVRIGLAAEAVDERDVFLFHKTTHRAVYDQAKASRPDCDDVILWNSRGEITETTIANIVLIIDGEHLTPPVESGLLAGTMRRHLIERGDIRERVLTKEDLARAEEIYLINSVRKRIKTRVGY